MSTRLSILMALMTLLLPDRPAASGSDEPAESSVPESPAQLSFEVDIHPILQARCSHCHGTDSRKADLSLESPDAILRGGESGPAIDRSHPEESLLMTRIRSGEMPPEGETPLTGAESRLLERWVLAQKSTGPADMQAGSQTTPVSQHDVVPILLRRCTVCHGHRRAEAGLDLRTRASMLLGGKSGPAIVPGKPDDSLLLQRVHAGEMPPLERLVDASVKPMTPSEITILRDWIAAGAPEIDRPEDVAGAEPDRLVTDQDRSFWSFQTPRQAVVPNVRNTAQVRNPIDAFVLQKLEAAGLTMSPEADRTTLIRRASFDLTGLPPEPDDVRAFLQDDDPQAYEQIIERLLASPHYGERWGRYWLDLAGYADSEGKREQDLPRPHAWRYRDYVIRSFNDDKPYDRFLTEQLAGDELADYDQAVEITPEICDNLVATGFLRMAPDASWANITGYVPDRLEVIADEIDILGSAVLGLTIKCARCHSHKFDPIPQRDYYRLTAVFKGALDEYDWLKPEIRPGIGPVSTDLIAARHLPHVTTAERQAWEAAEARILGEITAARERGEAPERLQALEAQRTPEPRIQALWDRGTPSPTYVYRRGDPESPGPLVGPGVPSVLTDGQTPFDFQPPWPGARSTGRRLAFARWITRPDHPLTARVLVNRVWKHHFGTGIVRSLANFGRAGTAPTHPELLDWLAVEFTRQAWSRRSAMIARSVIRTGHCTHECP
jgi:Protein of unknown function (DUF1549)/Protein of unknown function (DUF1553)/Planctomycete cytochrome C